jgi:hypothetical protein
LAAWVFEKSHAHFLLSVTRTATVHHLSHTSLCKFPSLCDFFFLFVRIFVSYWRDNPNIKECLQLSLLLGELA